MKSLYFCLFMTLACTCTCTCTCAGCAGSFVEATPLNAPPRALVARAPGSVEVYSSTAPTRPHVDIALLRADRPNYGDIDTPRLVQALLEQAAKLGCDALFISGTAQRQAASDELRFLDPGSTSLLATCIAYLPGTASPVPAGPASRAAANAVILVPDEQPKPKPVAVVDNVAMGERHR